MSNFIKLVNGKKTITDNVVEIDELTGKIPQELLPNLEEIQTENYYTKDEVDYKLELDYYTETEMQTSGSQQLHWDNLTNVPQLTLNTDTDISTNSWVLDEDDFQSNDQTKVPTQQSTKLYIDNKISSSQGEGLLFNTDKIDSKLVLYEEDTTPETFIEKSTGTRILMVETSDSFMDGDDQPSYSENGDILLIKEIY